MNLSEEEMEMIRQMRAQNGGSSIPSDIDRNTGGRKKHSSYPKNKYTKGDFWGIFLAALILSILLFGLG